MYGEGELEEGEIIPEVAEVNDGESLAVFTNQLTLVSV